MTRTRLLSILERQGIAFDEGEVFDVPIRGLLGSNPKVVKGVKRGYATAIMHLSPSDRSGLQTCSNATAGCRAACLNTAGRGGVFAKGETDNSIQRARRRKTHWFFARRAEFMTQLDREIQNHVKLSAAKGLVPCIRLNGTSDIRWETIRDANGTTVFDRHPSVTFYDYTKHPDRDVSDIPNYSLTFSLAESNDSSAKLAAANGLNVAVVFKSVPAEFLGRPVVDGDESDLRFLDPSGVVVGLKAKGAAKQDTSGFVR
jgi:hypothetical protein